MFSRLNQLWAQASQEEEFQFSRQTRKMTERTKQQQGTKAGPGSCQLAMSSRASPRVLKPSSASRLNSAARPKGILKSKSRVQNRIALGSPAGHQGAPARPAVPRAAPVSALSSERRHRSAQLSSRIAQLMGADETGTARGAEVSVKPLRSKADNVMLPSTTAHAQQKDKQETELRFHLLNAKIRQLETTIDSLKEELGRANERSLRLEQSLSAQLSNPNRTEDEEFEERLNRTILKSEELEKIEPPSTGRKKTASGASAMRDSINLPEFTKFSPVKL